MKCLRCNRELTRPGQTIGEVCKRKALKESSAEEKKIRVEPLTTARNYHSYLVFTSPRKIVKIYIDPVEGKTADCECGSLEICEHVRVAAERDSIRFPKSEVAKCF